MRTSRRGLPVRAIERDHSQRCRSGLHQQTIDTVQGAARQRVALWAAFLILAVALLLTTLFQACPSQGRSSTPLNLALVIAAIGVLAFISKYLEIVWKRVRALVLPEGHAPHGTQDTDESPSAGGDVKELSASKYHPAVLFVLACAMAGIGGFLWAALNRLNGAVGFMCESSTLGGDAEPHGGATILWALVTLLPIVVVPPLLFAPPSAFQQRHRVALLNDLSWLRSVLRAAWASVQAVRSAWTLVGATAGAWIFYNLPLSFDHPGFRGLLGSSYPNEVLLAALWSFLVSAPAYALAEASEQVVVPKRGGLRRSAGLVLARLVVTVAAVTATVTGFLVVFPLDDSSAAARGLLAGLSLRAALFICQFWPDYTYIVFARR